MTLKKRSRSPKSNQLLSLSQRYIHASLVKFRRLVQEIIHIRGYKKWDADGIRTETSMCFSYLRGRGGAKNSEIAGTAFYYNFTKLDRNIKHDQTTCRIKQRSPHLHFCGIISLCNIPYRNRVRSITLIPFKMIS